MDVVIGCGWGVDKDEDKAQGKNFVPGNRYLAAEDLAAIDVRQGGRYFVATRQSAVAGNEGLQAAAHQAATSGGRLLGYYGVASHLPFQTADGDYRPAPGRAKAETYTEADLYENPTLAQMTTAALTVLSQRPQGFWLMVESGDVDWANHDNNLDNSIGAVNSGDAAVTIITEWVEQHSNWNETVLIVTADHGHLLVLDRPEDLIPPAAEAKDSLLRE
jgi:alkaline phosphatase